MEALCCRNSALAEQLGKIEATALHHEPQRSWPSPGLQGRPRKPPPRDWAWTWEGPRCTREGTHAHVSPQHTEPLGPGSSQLSSSWKGTEKGQMPLRWVLCVATSGDFGAGEQQGAIGQQLRKSWLNAHPQMFSLCSLSLHPQLQWGVPQRGVVRFPRLARNQGNGQKVTSQDIPPSTSGCRQVPHCSFPRGDVRGLRGTVLWPGGDGWVGWEPGAPKLAVFSLSKSLFVPHLTPTLHKRKPATE